MHIIISEPYFDFGFGKDLNFIFKSFSESIQKPLVETLVLNLNIQSNFQKFQI
jgi:hypothetical protein